MCYKKIKIKLLFVLWAFLSCNYTFADKLDSVLAGGVVRCGVVLEYPPMGFRDENNNPVGMDVDICADLAKSMKIKYELVPLTWAQRIPSLISRQVDVVIASSSITLDRAQTIGFTIPYMKFQFQVLLNEKAKVNSWGDLKHLNIGTSVGTTYESLFLDYKKEYWKDSKGKYFSFESEGETLKAVSEGKVDGAILSDTSINHAINTGELKGVKVGPIAPFGVDIAGMMTLRKEYGWIRYLNLFIYTQATSGRMSELYKQWLGGEMPDITTIGTYY